MVDVTAPLKFSPGKLLEWWLGELAGLVPRRLRQTLRRGTPTLVLDLSGQELVVRRFRGGKCQEIGRVPRAEMDTAAGRSSIRALVRKANVKKDGLAVLLPADQALLKTLELPSEVESDLREALFFQIDRQTPFTPEEVYFDYWIRGRHRETNRLTVELTVVPRSVVDNALEMAGRWGVQATVVDVAGDGPEAAPRLNLLSTAEHEEGTRAWSPLNALFAGFAVALAAAAIYIPLDQQRMAAEALSEKVTRAKSEAEDAVGLRRELDRLAEDGRFLTDQKQRAPVVLEIFGELTRLLPDDTWIHQLRLNRGEIRIVGYSSAASTLIGLIDQSPMFQTPRFQSPVVQDPKTGLERFTLSFELEGERGA